MIKTALNQQMRDVTNQDHSRKEYSNMQAFPNQQYQKNQNELAEKLRSASDLNLRSTQHLRNNHNLDQPYTDLKQMQSVYEKPNKTLGKLKLSKKFIRESSNVSQRNIVLNGQRGYSQLNQYNSMVNSNTQNNIKLNKI